jgi:hypothetical protein
MFSLAAPDENRGIWEVFYIIYYIQDRIDRMLLSAISTAKNVAGPRTSINLHKFEKAVGSLKNFLVFRLGSMPGIW